ncbi:MAG: 2-C-methyl-D-erythritol 4-phosphate cytidylyltransferase [Candidatus Raymondbacteria bacterium RifOxyC12_full_50_8]|uniref:2-C-methyl-D-erythritol 4-phosphate cytidylyltransferase n=1 Tax=Candidatus Raymondbacteria bacterium RIFOXYD12_FULL_49_13 TaxID=1817890 RepID=A0A1F7FHV0_UNCRA|nr:MAG: 2-C-methyl-D-erythritol 4-phosphate cytidylyltransferase [Candidatus Raymondbacteria bacterium RIFOXYA2_FULL_49_16]OGJ95701.1 MAG: 2-C-methyl-D-erythritol 4-phosphate cytidylyltransferase [Candidatus Raymondbacteria bacterium RifOxyB12_full_50_8]OGK05937.1 MAG: 2-C-methyl-D-erythritol 4-phosphate cytidylyltransferase [Candidatus Raymondbacteria bacterium RifOxyC12_full_50_8]OGK06295.1 MAG: 2-C-methyl-D-erythritol 4-phosphate cytidylyltransferase [Candidatus Raymondbacteria bacterium RIFO
MKAAVIIPAGGSGKRMGAAIEKQFLKIGGVSILDRCLAVFNKHPQIMEIVVVVPEKRVAPLSAALKKKFRKITAIVAGGKERTHSVSNGFRALTKKYPVVLTHDAVRPFVTPDIITRSIDACRKYDGLTIAVPAKDTIKKVRGTRIEATLTRDELWQVQTPQAFRYKVLEHALRFALDKKMTATDDCAIAERLGYNMHVVMGAYANIKITTKEDLVFGRTLCQQ